MRQLQSYLGYSRPDKLSEVALKIIKSTSAPVHLALGVNVLVELDHPCLTKLKEIIITG